MPPHDAVPEMLRPVWERSLPLLRERLDQLDHIAAAILANTLTPEDLDLARSNAHKLAGSLGTFGYPTGTDLARSIESLLEPNTPLDAPLLKQHTTNLRSLLNIP